MTEAAKAQSIKTALVTGGGSGMGRAICLRLAREGRQVGVLGDNPDNIAEVAQLIIEGGGKAIAVRADVADRAQVDAAVLATRAALGPITILVNNAAVENFCPFPEITEENWDNVLRVNLKGMYNTTQSVLPDMLAASWGRIVTLSALGAQIGAPNMVHYTASKGAVIAMTRSLAVELGPRGITVNSISPGFIDTPMSRRAIDSNLFPVPYEQIIASYPIPRLGEPEEIAFACSFFVSEEAGYITAQLLGVNGGCAP
ncbi:SDR family NAD(P)-dependent oxidoreductase [Acidocella sp.]|uniref:SDR family NAD(P)-dependent oxidoreductase n=1 Tax=Acidocella sp. TaxID=50710 RepID=UPI00260F6E5E|nr:SDR family NAD(P)-dependent oxidoreductase [Acidocella sp.]